MEYIELLGVKSPSFKSKKIHFLSSIPSLYSINELKLMYDKILNNEKVRFEFDLQIDKAMDFAYNLINYGFLIGDSSIHEEGN